MPTATVYAASTGDINELKRLVALGYDLNSADYDGRTPLHLAAAEGQAPAVRYLLAQGVAVAVTPTDRWWPPLTLLVELSLRGPLRIKPATGRNRARRAAQGPDPESLHHRQRAGLPACLRP
jgi:ankyrin repeat protein